MKSKIILKIKEKVEKQLKADLLAAIAYLDWVANIVPMLKKDRKVRMCVDYKDLNWASPKDNFLLPRIDALVDNTTTNRFFSFVDRFLSYNQIKMAKEDKAKTAFTTHWGCPGRDAQAQRRDDDEAYQNHRCCCIQPSIRPITSDSMP